MKFLGQLIDDKGIHPDPAKIAAIQNVSEPKRVADVRRFLGMANQMNKFLPSLADTTQLLRELLKANMLRSDTFDRLSFTVHTCTYICNCNYLL